MIENIYCVRYEKYSEKLTVFTLKVLCEGDDFYYVQDEEERAEIAKRDIILKALDCKKLYFEKRKMHYYICGPRINGQLFYSKDEALKYISAVEKYADLWIMEDDYENMKKVLSGFEESLEEWKETKKKREAEYDAYVKKVLSGVVEKDDVDDIYSGERTKKYYEDAINTSLNG